MTVSSKQEDEDAGSTGVDRRAHWQTVYETRAPDSVSWYEPTPESSLLLIAEARLPLDAGILDAGGGASLLTHGLLDAGYRNLTVADISAAALARSRTELGERGSAVQWVQADLRSHNFGRTFDLWHDRAVFHFMVEEEDRKAYLGTLRRSLRPGGHLVIATFGPDGPQQCSNLPTARYDAQQLSVLLGEEFRLVSSRLVDHHTPSGKVQQFTYAHLKRAGHA